ncbi:uncharacterized protein LOC143580147 [Bidens hawaiensis]|uniref:uncharacterized protein LOC143580147 n=1 Tax=Bidens hawaiensis TaxID=980011 RepID=UPI00404AA893
MDKEQEEMQFIGLFDIIKESYKIIISCRKIFSQITLTLILPLAFIFQAYQEISNYMLEEIDHTDTEKFFEHPGTKRYTNLSNTLSYEWIKFWLFTIAYFTILFILSLLSTAAIVYTIASVYTGRELTFKKVMSIVPKVWLRLMITFTYMLSAFMVYLILYLCVLIISLKVLHGSAFVGFLNVFLVIYVMGFVYMTGIWQLASVVSVLESADGITAMTKSMGLIKGNRWVAISISFVLNMSFVYIQLSFQSLVVEEGLLEAWKRFGFGVLCFLLLLTLFLFGLVIQTILYLVCKSYHHENIDKGDLSNHLESYLRDYEPLIGKEVQLEEYRV